MKTKLKLLITLTFVLAPLALVAPKSQTQTQVETAGQKFKSIKVLNNMPADQMGKVMNMISASLGVNCKFCHTSNDADFEKEGNEHKDTARQMMKMMFELNKTYFNNRPEINCNSCHKGISHPQPGFPLTPPVPQPERPKQPEKRPPFDDLLAKYQTALGGKAKMDKVASRYVKANRLEPDGKTTEAEEIWQKGGKWLASTNYGKAVVTEGFDGTTAWKRAGSDAIQLLPDEAEQIKREGFIMAGDLKSIYDKADVRGLDRIDGKEVWFVTATTKNNLRERVYFDTTTGLLVRRAAGTPTILGQFTYQVDYLDYKDFGGVRLPTTVKYSMPGIYWTRKIMEVKSNASVDDAKFGGK